MLSQHNQNQLCLVLVQRVKSKHNFKLRTVYFLGLFSFILRSGYKSAQNVDKEMYSRAHMVLNSPKNNDMI